MQARVIIRLSLRMASGLCTSCAAALPNTQPLWMRAWIGMSCPQSLKTAFVELSSGVVCIAAANGEVSELNEDALSNDRRQEAGEGNVIGRVAGSLAAFTV